MADEGIGAGEELGFPGVAREFFRFSIYDARREHIVTMQLRRRPGMTDEEMAQFQNYLWTQIGMAVRDDRRLQDRLRLGGIEVLTEDPEPPVAAPGA